jgi:hypothetical protein
MSVGDTVSSLVEYIRREEYAIAVQIANRQLCDGHLEELDSFARLLGKWAKGEHRLREHVFCFRSVYRSVFFEDLLRRALADFSNPAPLPATAIDVPCESYRRRIELSLRLAGLTALEMDAWLAQRWRLTEKVTRDWVAPTHSRHAQPSADHN